MSLICTAGTAVQLEPYPVGVHVRIQTFPFLPFVAFSGPSLCVRQPYFVDFPSVLKEMSRWFEHLHHTGVLPRAVEVTMVVGADMLKTGVHESYARRGWPLLVALRPGG